MMPEISFVALITLFADEPRAVGFVGIVMPIFRENAAAIVDVGFLRGSGDVVLVVADMVLVETEVGHIEAASDLLIVLDFREFDRISVSSSGFLLFCGSGRVRVR